MEYWIVYKIERGEFYYVAGTDRFGYPIHTKSEDAAWHFKDFRVVEALAYLGYESSKRYV